MKLRVGSFTSRFIAVALLAFLVLAGFQLVITPMITAHRETGRAIELSQGLVNRYQALSSGRTQLAARLKAVEKTVTGTAAYMSESSDALAGAALQNHVQNIVERAGGELHSSRVLPIESVKRGVSVRLVALKLELVVEVEALQDLVYQLETSQPVVFIRELSISGVTEARHGSDAGSKPMLDVRLQVYGFMRAPTIVRDPTALVDQPERSRRQDSPD